VIDLGPTPWRSINFRDALRDATQSDETKDRIFGHHRQSTGRLYGGRDLTPEEPKVIDRVKFKGLKLDHLIPW
jgi:hypothetical protein